MRADADGIFVNIGHKAEGIVPPNEMRTLDTTEGLSVGDEILTFVIKPENADQAAILSIDRAIGERAWHDLEKMVESAETVEGKVAGFNRGGAIVDVEGIQGFVPMSQLVSVSRGRFRETRPPEPAPPAASDESTESTDATESEVEDVPPPPPPEPEPPDPDLGKVLQLKVLEINRSRNRAIFSERQAIQEQRNEQKARLIEDLTEGETRRGKVTGISSFGAFVDLGGADGLIHISELSWTPVKTPEEVVNLGDEIDVFVLRVDAVNKKIALSLRRLQPEPWETIHERFNVGDVVEATITKLTNFGAFARVENYVEGLIHISELSTRMINHPREVVREGESLQVKILRIEPERRRMGLSLRQMEAEFGGADYDDGG
jgi:small subunit ribosomal protein S1